MTRHKCCTRDGGPEVQGQVALCFAPQMSKDACFPRHTQDGNNLVADCDQTGCRSTCHGVVESKLLAKMMRHLRFWL